MKWNTVLLMTGLLGLGLVGATQGLRAPEAEAQTTYWANGNLQSRVEVDEGVPNGRSARWHPDGTKHAEGVVREGRMEGRWDFWLANGTPDVQRTGTYAAGIRLEESATTGGGR